MVLGGAAVSGAMFDGLPMFLDVVLVMLVFPFVLLILALLVDAKIITPRWPGWLRKSDGREADSPALLMAAVLAASIAAIYPGMFPARTYANLTLWGPALEVAPENAPSSAAYYRFIGATLRADLGGARSRKVYRSTGNNTEFEIVVTHAAPIVGRSWTAGDEVVAWALSEEELPPWREGSPDVLQGTRLSDERDHALRAVQLVAEKRDLRLASDPIMIELGDDYEVQLRRSRNRTWLVLAPLCLLVFAGVAAKTWSTLRPTS